MKPLIVIPSYWAPEVSEKPYGEPVHYDHTTPTDKPLPELETCLASLEKVRGVLRVAILLVCPRESEAPARARVNSICRAHTRLNPLVVGRPEFKHIQDVLDRAAPGYDGELMSLRGYGAIRNVGLALASIFGHDIAVFMDDDELALNENFLIDAVWGLGEKTRQNLPVVAKTGFFLNSEDSPFAPEKPSWTNAYWSKHEEFNEWIEAALASQTRIVRSNTACGGCMALHADAFTRVGFDPYITRGEDLDYLINLRAYGLDMWFDNQWFVKHQPPATTSSASRFLQDVYRWTYETAKVEVLNGQNNLTTITAASLEPYPGDWVSPASAQRIRTTLFRRMLTQPEFGAYFKIWRHGLAEAREYAQTTAQAYLKFQSWWPRVITSLWDAEPLAQRILASGSAPAAGETATFIMPGSLASRLGAFNEEGAQ